VVGVPNEQLRLKKGDSSGDVEGGGSGSAGHDDSRGRAGHDEGEDFVGNPEVAVTAET
jgi:hypothetical protein